MVQSFHMVFHGVHDPWSYCKHQKQGSDLESSYNNYFNEDQTCNSGNGNGKGYTDINIYKALSKQIV